MLSDLSAETVKEIIVITGPTDMRKGAERLAMMVQSEFSLDPCAPGVLYVFCGMRKDRLRCIIWENDGWTMLVRKKLNGRFNWPGGERQAKSVAPGEFHRILEGTSVKDSMQVNEKKLKSEGESRKKPARRFYFY